MNKFGDFLEKVFDGGMYLLMVGLFFVAAVIIFIFVGGIVGIIFNSFTTGLVIGLVVTIVIIYALYRQARWNLSLEGRCTRWWHWLPMRV